MDKYDDCYRLGSQIIDKYIELLVSPIYAMDEDMLVRMVESILDMVIDEYELLHSIGKKEIDLCINKVNSGDKSNNYESIVRIKNKLVDCKEILNGMYITTLELGLNEIDNDMKFSIYDAIISMINIDVIKILKNKIYSLESSCDSDDRFIDLLKQRLKISKIELLFNTSVSEIVSLYYNTSIDDMPRIDINKIKNKILKLNNPKLNNLIHNTIVIFITKNVRELSKIRIVNNNDNDVFKYLFTITQIEVLINYLDKNKLKELYDFCIKMTNNENIASMENVKRLVKWKMNN